MRLQFVQPERRNPCIVSSSTENTFRGGSGIRSADLLGRLSGPICIQPIITIFQVQNGQLRAVLRSKWGQLE